MPSGAGIGDIDWSKVDIGDPTGDATWAERRAVPAARLVSTDDTLGGDVRFDGTRIGLRTVLGALTDATPMKVEAMYPGLPDGWYEVVQALRPYLRRTHRNVLR